MVHIVRYPSERGPVIPNEVHINKFSRLIPGYTSRNQPIAEVIQHHYLGSKRSGPILYAAAKGVLRSPGEFQEFLSQVKDKRVCFHPGGAFVLLLEFKFGESWIPDLKEKLRLLIRLTSILRVLKRHNFAPTYLSLDTISFEYAPETSCTISIPNDHTDAITIKLSPATSNPHMRIKPTLELLLNSSPHVFLHTLPLTLPLLRALSRVDASGGASVRCRGADHYRLAYTNLWTVFDISLRMRRGVQEWHLSEMPPPGSSNPQTLKQITDQKLPEQMTTISEFWNEGGEGWRGMGNVMVCSAEGIEIAMDKLDERLKVVLALQATKAKEKAAANSSNGTANGKQPNQLQNGQKRPSFKNGIPSGASVITLE
jgi:hypothetical protein